MRQQLRYVVLVSAVLLSLPTRAPADEFTIVETLAPNNYTVAPGGGVTLFGFFTVTSTLSDPSAFTYDREFLFGLQPDSPHLTTTSGALVSSTDFDPPINAAYFQDVFADTGYLGPAGLPGTATTAITPWRTFVVPSNTPVGSYRYSYGISFLPQAQPGLGGQTLFDTSLTINVSPVPEPGTVLLVGSALIAAGVRRRRTCRSRCT
jgi:hypothetical protein